MFSRWHLRELRFEPGPLQAKDLRGSILNSHEFTDYVHVIGVRSSFQNFIGSTTLQSEFSFAIAIVRSDYSLSIQLLQVVRGL